VALLLQTLALMQSAEAKPPGGGGGGGGKPIKVGEPVPNNAYQGDQGKHILLNGSNFPDSAKVTFLFSLDQSEGSVTVLQDPVTRNADGLLEFDIDVDSNADLGDYDILVEEYIEPMLLSGRKGKGTTLFSVQAKVDNVLNCAPFIDPDYDPLVDPYDTAGMETGTCTCEFSLNSEDTSQGTPPGFIYNLIADCETGQTLTIPQFGNIRSLGAVQGSGSERKTITAVNGSGGTFAGEAIIENTGHRATARDFNIVVGPGVKAGCDGGIRSALRFELDEDSADPTIPDPFYIHTRWNIGDIWVSTDGEPLCNAIEARRTSGYPLQWNDQAGGGPYDAYDARLDVAGGWIKTWSYAEYGVIYEGCLCRSDSLRSPLVSGIRIDPPATGGSGPVGIWTGGITSSDPDSPVAAHVDETVITMTSGTGATGIVAYGASDGPIESDFSIGKNVISGAYYGILVDDHVDEVNFSGNTLTGDDEAGSVGIDSEACDSSFKGKPNHISGFATDIDASPAAGCP
jgi:hypothetical protein